MKHKNKSEELLELIRNLDKKNHELSKKIADKEKEFEKIMFSETQEMRELKSKIISEKEKAEDSLSLLHSDILSEVLKKFPSIVDAIAPGHNFNCEGKIENNQVLYCARCVLIEISEGKIKDKQFIFNTMCYGKKDDE